MRCKACGQEEEMKFRGGDFVVVDGDSVRDGFVGLCIVLNVCTTISTCHRGGTGYVRVVSLRDGIYRSFHPSRLSLRHGHIHVDKA